MPPGWKADWSGRGPIGSHDEGPERKQRQPLRSTQPLPPIQILLASSSSDVNFFGRWRRVDGKMANLNFVRHSRGSRRSKDGRSWFMRYDESMQARANPAPRQPAGWAMGVSSSHQSARSARADHQLLASFNWHEPCQLSSASPASSAALGPLSWNGPCHLSCQIVLC